MKNLIHAITLLFALSAGAQVKVGPKGVYSTGEFPAITPEWFKSNIRNVKSLADRDAIPDNFRDTGLIVYVWDSLAHYTLKTGKTNADWVKLYADGIPGAKGDKGDPGPQGIQGVKGDKGDKGDPGPSGSSIKVLGSLANTGLLPAESEIGDSYVINDSLWVSNGTSFTNAGMFRGPQGATGPAGAGIEPGDKGDINVSTLSSWIIKNSTITTAKLADGIDVSKLASGEVTNTIFNYLKNVNGDIQTQFNNKVPTSRTITINGVTQSLSNNVSFTVSSDGGASGELITID